MIVLENTVKPGVAERFARLRRMGLRTVMVTGDNPLTAAAITAQAGVDAFLAEATPEAKLAHIRNGQGGGSHAGRSCRRATRAERRGRGASSALEGLLRRAGRDPSPAGPFEVNSL